MLRENILENLLGDRLLRSEKQIVHDGLVAVLHRKRLWDKLEAGLVSQPVAERRDDRIVRLLDKIAVTEQIALSVLSDGNNAS